MEEVQTFSSTFFATVSLAGSSFFPDGLYIVDFDAARGTHPVPWKVQDTGEYLEPAINFTTGDGTTADKLLRIGFPVEQYYQVKLSGPGLGDDETRDESLLFG